ncbi:MAG: hypothetical protein K0S36_656 [Nitrosospira multiformis]|nr:hypothetical protein [Nitrosospira multiformis]
MRYLNIIAVMLFFTSTVHAAVTEDAYIAGYAAGVLKHGFGMEIPTLVVKDGIITVSEDKLKSENRGQVVQALSKIPGVAGVTIAEESVSRTAEREAFKPIQHPSATSREPGAATTETEAGVPAAGPTVLATGMLPAGHLFKPLLADPRWAHFSAAYRNYVGNNIDGNNNAAVSFGETIPFYRANFGQSTVQWEAGLQAAVFSDFNLGAPSADLINTDFIASAYGSVRAGHFSAFGRIYHQSSHLGDELLLRRLTNLERINLSYEGADLRLSYELPYGLRVYGGGGGIFHKEPSTIKPWSIQYGVEFRSPWRIAFLPLRPIVAVDLKNHQQNDWNADVSARAGVQLDHFRAFGRNLQFLVEYFHGNSPTGQFFRQRVDYLGIGAHYHF